MHKIELKNLLQLHHFVFSQLVWILLKIIFVSFKLLCVYIGNCWAVYLYMVVSRHKKGKKSDKIKGGRCGLILYIERELAVVNQLLVLSCPGILNPEE